jgi:hypothetical protein
MPLHRVLSTILLLLAVGCAAVADAVPEPSSQPGRRLVLDPERPDLERAGALDVGGSLEIAGAGPKVGGLSGLWILAGRPGGIRFVSVSDVGRVVCGQLKLDQAGRLVGVEGLRTAPLLDVDGMPVRGRRADSEEVVRLPGDGPEGEWPGGGWLVSFERAHRLMRYPDSDDCPTGRPVEVPAPPGLEDAPYNEGLEAMAVLPDGRIVVFEEGKDDGGTERRAWIARLPLRQPQDWQRLTLRVAPRFRPTGAAALPSGDLLVLQRRATLAGGWGARLVRVPAARLAAGAVAGAVIDGEELIRLEPPYLTDNFEGVAVASGPHGQSVIYLVSDDNFSVFQRTLLLQFILPAGR